MMIHCATNFKFLKSLRLRSRFRRIVRQKSSCTSAKLCARSSWPKHECHSVYQLLCWKLVASTLDYAGPRPRHAMLLNWLDFVRESLQRKVTRRCHVHCLACLAQRTCCWKETHAESTQTERNPVHTTVRCQRS